MLEHSKEIETCDVVTSIGTLRLLDGTKFWLQRRCSDHVTDNEKLEIILV